MRTIAARLGVWVLLLAACLTFGCSDSGSADQDGGVVADGVRPAPDSAQPGQDGTQPGQDGTQPGQDGAQPGQDGAQPGQDGAQPGQDSGGSLPPDLAAWCTGTTAKFRIGDQDQYWTGMDGPAAWNGTEITVEPQFTVGGVKHSFLLTAKYAHATLTPFKVDLANLSAGESVKMGGASGPIVPADRRKGILEVVSAGGGFRLQVCAWVDGESYYFAGMPLG